jgi:hypothetical protein
MKARIWALSAAVVIGLAAIAQAGALDVKQIPADAVWLAHVDVDAMRDSIVVQRVYAHVIQQWPGTEKHFEGVQADFGVDLRTDVHGLTLYGKAIGQPEGVLIIDTNIDQKRLLDKAQYAPDHQVVTYGSYEIHTWTHDKNKKHAHAVAGVFFKPTVLVFASSVDSAKTALDVLGGKSASLAGKESLLTAAVPAGATLVARAIGLGNVAAPCKSPLDKKLDAFSLATGEQSGESFLHAKVITQSQETADQFKAMAEGGRALAMFQANADADAVKFLQQIKITTANKIVELELRAPAEDVLKMLQKAEQLAQHHHAEHKKPEPKKEGQK